jgi:hypothetical protein
MCRKCFTVHTCISYLKETPLPHDCAPYFHMCHYGSGARAAATEDIYMNVYVLDIDLRAERQPGHYQLYRQYWAICNVCRRKPETPEETYAVRESRPLYPMRNGNRTHDLGGDRR